MDDATHRLDDPSASAELLALASPSAESKAFADAMADQSPRVLVGGLAGDGHFPEAVKLLALALPRREAVWWACRCCRESLTGDEPPEALSALEAAERWAADPIEEHRRAAHAAAEASGMEAPAGCAAMGAFFGGGSIAPPNVPDVPPAPHLTAHVVAGAVMLCAVRSEPEKAPEKYRAFLALGFSVADGADRPPPIALPAGQPAPVSPRPAPPSAREDRWGEESTRPPVPNPRQSPDPAPRPPSPAPPRTRRWDEWE
ncbi:hypothetical protein ElP_06210 [Tautonia plasticadhaerens]|uniref:Uncharacterized protein n=2 Tax=Tautonia plasticadhaerens TaxID=2527974 RepID=A0A518GW55_9BACT|nr:hypothetical protein ElP_06210 [Tautonia plasticadhaerens]